MRLFSTYYDAVINKINLVDYSIPHYKSYTEKSNYIEVKKNAWYERKNCTDLVGLI